MQLYDSIGLHDKYGGDSNNSSGFGLSTGIGDNIGIGNGLNIHYNQQNDTNKDDPHSSSSYSNYDRFGGLYDHIQTPYGQKDATTSGGFLSTDSLNNKQENPNKPMPIRTFPSSLDNASKPPQIKMDKSPDVIPHSTGEYNYSRFSNTFVRSTFCIDL